MSISWSMPSINWWLPMLQSLQGSQMFSQSISCFFWSLGDRKWPWMQHWYTIHLFISQYSKLVELNCTSDTFSLLIHLELQLRLPGESCFWSLLTPQWKYYLAAKCSSVFTSWWLIQSVCCLVLNSVVKWAHVHLKWHQNKLKDD